MLPLAPALLSIDEGGLQARLQLLGEDARDRVAGAAAARRGDDELDRLAGLRPVLGEGGAGEQAASSSANAAAKERRRDMARLGRMCVGSADIGTEPARWLHQRRRPGRHDGERAPTRRGALAAQGRS